MDIIKCENLTRVYRQGTSSVIAVNDVNLTVQTGEMVAITGKSGSGKTTLLRLLAGIDKPTTGTVFFNGVDMYAGTDAIIAAIRRKGIGLIFQNYNLLPFLTAKENILLPLVFDNKKPDAGYFFELVEALGIADRIGHLPSELSGGQQQRVAIARALINRPDVVLADEPTGNLDSKSADDIIRVLAEINGRGYTVAMVTHEKKYAEMCKRILTISDGVVSER